MSVRKLILSLGVAEMIILASVLVAFAWGGARQLGPDEGRYLSFALVVGFSLAVLAWLFCTALAGRYARALTMLVGLGIGVLTPVLAGWTWATLLHDPSVARWAYYWTVLDAWVESYELAIPGAIAGAAVGFLVGARRPTPPTPTMI